MPLEHARKSSLIEHPSSGLQVDPRVTDELIDDVLPLVEYVGFWQPGPEAARPESSQTTARDQAAVAWAFRAMLEDPSRLGHGFLVGRWIERGMRRDDAERRYRHLIEDLDDLEADLMLRAGPEFPSRGARALESVRFLVRGAALCWRRHTGEQPGQRRSRAFVRFCIALAASAGLQVRGEEVQAILDETN